VIVLDTDILTIIQYGDGEIYQRLRRRLRAALPEQVCVTIVTVEEQMRGWLAWIAKAKSPEQQIEAYARLLALLKDFQARPVLEFDGLAAGEFHHLQRAKIRIGTMDLKIAAIVLANNARLISRNLRDFQKVPELQVEDWTRDGE
jgi:tRNA(fMet)-specific endonuclease VapC